MTWDWYQLLNAVSNYYGSGSDQWATISQYGISSTEATAILKQIPGVNIVSNADGSVRSYSFSQITENTAQLPSTVDSNVVTVNGNVVDIPAEMAVETGSTTVAATSGLATSGNFVVGTVAPAVAAVGWGITLGKLFDTVLYHSNPDFWNDVGLQSLDPETWDTLTYEDDSIGARLVNIFFGLNPETGKAQAYIDQDLAAYLAQYMQNKGVFDNTGGYTSSGTIDQTDYTIKYRDAVGTSWVYDNVLYEIVETTGLTEAYSVGGADSGLIYSKTDGRYRIKRTSLNTGTEWYGWYNMSSAGSYYYGGLDYYNNSTGACTDNPTLPYNPVDISKILYETPQTVNPAIEGIGTQDGGTTPNLDNNDSVDDALQKLQEQYPDLWNNAVRNHVIQPDGSIKEYVYIPINIPDIVNPTDPHPTSGDQTQDEPWRDTENSTENELAIIIDLLSKIPTNEDQDTGEGNTPPVVIPPGSASALYTVYNPTNSEINSFGSWLWSANFVDQILKMFNDPMQAIISLHKVFCNPSISGRNSIKVGYLDSGVVANVVDSQYVTVPCGTVNLFEEFNNVFDYPPFTEVSLYLPFIGIVKLDANDVMRASITVTYHVDVLTGACLADVNVIRDMSGGVLYQYTGDCSVHYPLSSGSYMGMVSALLGVAGTIISGGSLAPMMIGATAKAMSGRSSVERSGNLSGNAGAMGIKKPYLVIQRPQTNLANVFETFVGKPANYTAKIKDCTGYISCTEVHIENCNGTDSELAELENLLKTGILI